MSEPEAKDGPEADVKAAPSLLRSSAVVSVMTLLSRVLGLARDIVIAALVGAGGSADSFFIAFKIPNFLRRLFAEGAFSQAFVPVLAEYRHKGPHETVKLLVDRVAGALGGSVLLVTLLAVIGAPVVTMIFAPGFHDDAEKFDLTANMIRITFPYLFLISMTGFAGAILNSYGHFAVPAFTPVLLNLALIGSALLMAPHMSEPAMALAWGVFIAGVFQLAFQLPFLHKLRLLPRPRWAWRDPGVQRIIHLMIPALFGVSVSQINLLLDTVLASFLPTGSVSWLYFSDRLVELPLGVFAIAIATVILPNLSRLKADKDETAFARTLDWGLRSVLLIAVPATAALFCLAQSILITLFQYGQMTARDTEMAGLSLQAYTVGLSAFMLIKVLAPGFYARQDTRTPVKIGIIAMVANMIFNVALVLPLNHYWQVGHVGLALATALSAWLNAGLLLRGLLKENALVWQPGWGRFAMQLLPATVLMVLFLVLGLPDAGQWLDAGLWQRIAWMTGLCIGGGGIYLMALFLAGVRLSHFRGSAN